jgi:UPF0755 protein
MSEKSNPNDGPKVTRASLFGRRDNPKPERPAAPSPLPPKRRRRSGLGVVSAFLSFMLVGALIGLGGFTFALLEAGRAGPLTQDKVVIITREDDGGPIAEQLERAGVIESAIFFSAMTMFDGTRSALKRGEYDFKAGSSLRDVEHLLQSGKVVLHSLTIPEGLTSDQIVQRLRDNDVLIGEVKEPPREGSLLPETYKFARGETRQALLSVMSKAQAKVVDEIWQRRAPDLPIKSPGELVTLASIVEKETGKIDERPRVAGAFVNRLQKHMKLQSDPTIVYGLVFGKGTLGHSITKAELNQPTPYNTYNIDGLPPGPICNPGKAALEAAANPSKTGDLYFVADGTGGHAFASTLDQHLKNVARWRQIEQDAKDKLAPDALPPGVGGPAPLPATKGEIRSVDPKVFGAMSPADSTAAKLDAKAKTLAAKLAKIGDSVRKQQALLGAGGALSPATLAATKTLDALGAIVTGVNDAPEVVTFATDSPGDAPSGTPVASAPMSPAALADQKAREAKYGYGVASAASSSVAPSQVSSYAPNPVNKGRVFDASEGTALDPLLNKTYDLSYAKEIPKNLTRPSTSN